MPFDDEAMTRFGPGINSQDQPSEVNGQSQVGAMQGQIARAASGTEDDIVETPSIGTAPFTDIRRIEQGPGTSGEEPACVGERRSVLVLCRGHDELGVALDLPDIDPQT